MIVALLLALSMLVVPNHARAQSPDAAATTRELTDIVARLGATYKSGDCDGWGALLAPDWSVTHISGQVITREEAIRSCKMPEVKIDTMVSDDLSVRAYGDAAVVTGRTTVSAGGQTVVLRFTDFFVRRDGRWLAVASQATRLGR
jgi:ketosteroid isomerase-like protein